MRFSEESKWPWAMVEFSRTDRLVLVPLSPGPRMTLFSDSLYAFVSDTTILGVCDNFVVICKWQFAIRADICNGCAYGRADVQSSSSGLWPAWRAWAATLLLTGSGLVKGVK